MSCYITLKGFQRGKGQDWKEVGMLWAVSGNKKQCQVRESTWRNGCERIWPKWGILQTRRAAESARTKSERGWKWEGLKDCRILKRVDNLAPAAGPGQRRSRQERLGRSKPAATRGATFLPVRTRPAADPGSRRRKWPPGPAARGLVAAGSSLVVRPGRARTPHGPQPSQRCSRGRTAPRWRRRAGARFPG